MKKQYPHIITIFLLIIPSLNNATKKNQQTRKERLQKICCYVPTCCGFCSPARREVCHGSCLYLCCNRDFENPQNKYPENHSFCERLFCVCWLWACCGLPGFGAEE